MEKPTDTQVNYHSWYNIQNLYMELHGTNTETKLGRNLVLS